MLTASCWWLGIWEARESSNCLCLRCICAQLLVKIDMIHGSYANVYFKICVLINGKNM
ncbi:hypothetical protein SEVIR_8G263150v4 [Setaria viridis]|uniref:Uncharacterized protein n=1 Tax=Setaria viridis TaxID=4556 RepID=A0A4U6TQ86_SETVI|nr:hypothetical protein SEVIR_8G263150v2 [Setaria viridis]